MVPSSRLETQKQGNNSWSTNEIDEIISFPSASNINFYAFQICRRKWRQCGWAAVVLWGAREGYAGQLPAWQSRSAAAAVAALRPRTERSATAQRLTTHGRPRTLPKVHRARWLWRRWRHWGTECARFEAWQDEGERSRSVDTAAESTLDEALGRSADGRLAEISTSWRWVG